VAKAQAENTLNSLWIGSRQQRKWRPWRGVAGREIGIAGRSRYTNAGRSAPPPRILEPVSGGFPARRRSEWFRKRTATWRVRDQGQHHRSTGPKRSRCQQSPRRRAGLARAQNRRERNKLCGAHLRTLWPIGGLRPADRYCAARIPGMKSVKTWSHQDENSRAGRFACPLQPHYKSALLRGGIFHCQVVSDHAKAESRAVGAYPGNLLLHVAVYNTFQSYVPVIHDDMDGRQRLKR
jgi:hypothetical protein